MNRYEDEKIKGLFYYEYYGQGLNGANEYAYLEREGEPPILIAEKDILSREIWYVDWKNKADFEKKISTKTLSGYMFSKNNINEDYKETVRKAARKVLCELDELNRENQIER